MGVSIDDRIKEAVDLVGKNPGVNSFGLCWIYAGGRVEGGKLVGDAGGLSLTRFAGLLKLQARLFDAKKQGKIKTGDSIVESTSAFNYRGREPVGYYPIGYSPELAAKNAQQERDRKYEEQMAEVRSNLDFETSPMPTYLQEFHRSS